MLACAALVNRPGGRAGLADAMLNHSYRINDQRQPLDSEKPSLLYCCTHVSPQAFNGELIG